LFKLFKWSLRRGGEGEAAQAVSYLKTVVYVDAPLIVGTAFLKQLSLNP